MDRLTVSDFRFDVTLSRCWPWRHFTQKNAATWWVITRHQLDTHAAAYVSSWSICTCLVVSLVWCSYLVAVGPDAAAISATVPAVRADVKVVPRSLLPTTPEQWQHVVFLWTGLRDMPETQALHVQTFIYCCLSMLPIWGVGKMRI